MYTKTSPYICVIGGANIDIQGFPEKKLVYHDSNPGQLKISLGGVGRNIAETLCLLGVPAKLVSVIGDDVYGEKILSLSKTINLDMSDTLIVKDRTTSTYLSILDADGDMALALSSMNITDYLDIEFIKKKSSLINNSKITVIDTNLHRDVIEYIVKNNTKCDYFLDLVSTAKAEKIKDLIGYFHTVKPNILETEILSGIKVKTDNDLLSASNYLIGKGVKNVFITSKKGVFYNNGTEYNFIKSLKMKPVNATGAGDAFVAGLAYSHFHGLNINESVKNAMAASFLTVQHEDTINPDININEINKIKKVLKSC